MPKCNKCNGTFKSSVIKSHRQKCGAVPKEESPEEEEEVVVGEDPTLLARKLVWLVWRLSFPLGTQPSRLIFTIFVIWPLVYRFLGKGALEGAAGFLTVGKTFFAKVQGIYSFLGFFESEDEDVTLAGAVSDFGRLMKSSLLQGQPPSEYQAAKLKREEARNVQRSVEDGLKRLEGVVDLDPAKLDELHSDVLHLKSLSGLLKNAKAEAAAAEVAVRGASFIMEKTKAIKESAAKAAAASEQLARVGNQVGGAGGGAGGADGNAANGGN